MYKDQKISLVLPCYNEEEGLQCVLPDIPPVIDEVVVVDNNCTDDTVQVATKLGARVVPESRPGYGAAYKAGFRSAQGDIIVTMDADGMYLIEPIYRLLKLLDEENYDFITCRRIPDRRRTFSSMLRYTGDVVINHAMWLTLGINLFDSQSGMWVFRKNILEKIQPTSDGMALSEELKILAFLHPEIKAAEIPVLYRDVRVGESKLNVWGDGINNLIFVFKNYRGWRKMFKKY